MILVHAASKSFPSVLALRLQEDHSALQREREAFEEEKALCRPHNFPTIFQHNIQFLDAIGAQLA